MDRFTLDNYVISDKTIFLRTDFNVPIKDNKVVDDRKIRQTLPTIKHLLAQNCKIIIASHLGRPKGRVVPSLRMAPIVKILKELLPKENIIGLSNCIGKDIKERVKKGNSKIFVLENLRFYKEEEENDLTFAHCLAEMADIYVNDAFASYRKHASVHAITKFLPAVSGFLMEKEITNLSKALHPKKPAIWLMGGAKLTKIDLIQQALNKADYILIGGALAFSFLRAQGISTGMSKIDTDSIRIAKRILKQKNSKKIILPLDFVVTESFTAKTKSRIVPFNQIKSKEIGLDLGPETIGLFKRYLRKAHTIVWNGPLGYFEWAQFAASTKEIGRFIGNLTATTIVGGGETVESVHKFQLDHNLSHISTGGGAALAFLSGAKLPAIEALEKNYLKYRRKKLLD